MLSMKRVVMVSNSDPPSTSTSQAGATVCSLAKRDELVGWEVSPVVFMASLTLLTLTNSITSLTLFQTNRKAQRMANTFQHRLTVTWICTCLTSTLHRAAGLSGAVNNKRSSTYLLWICLCIILRIMTGGGSCWSMQCTLIQSDDDDETRVTWFISTQASAGESQEVFPYGFFFWGGDLTWEAWRPHSLKKPKKKNPGPSFACGRRV